MLQQEGTTETGMRSMVGSPTLLGSVVMSETLTLQPLQLLSHCCGLYSVPYTAPSFSHGLPLYGEEGRTGLQKSLPQESAFGHEGWSV